MDNLGFTDHNKYVFKFFAEIDGKYLPNTSNENILVNLYELLCWNPDHSLEEPDNTMIHQYFLSTSHGNYIVLAHTEVDGSIISLKGYKQDSKENQE